ncbi:MAG: hypothetical protein AAFV98_13105 [Chloroflexota bacterium]
MALPERANENASRTGEFERVEKEPRPPTRPERPTSVPEVDIVAGTGSTTGIMRIRREGQDNTAKGEDNRPD